MSEKCIVRNEWEDFFDDLSKKIKNLDEKVKIEIIAPSVFEREEGKGLHIIGLSYDPKANVFSILCEDIEHLINNPQEVCIEEYDGAITQVRINDNSGMEHIIKFSIPIK